MTIVQELTYIFSLPYEYDEWQRFLKTANLNEWREIITTTSVAYTLKRSFKSGESEVRNE